ncbi:MAG: hypothetical protein ACRCZS_22670 [Chroococcidiopsis sp.]
MSAKNVLNSILNKTNDEYLKSFHGFTESVEKFLTHERGFLEIKQTVTELNEVIQAILDELKQYEKVLVDKIKDSEVGKNKIIEQIGEACGADTKTRLLANQLREEVFEIIVESWDNWTKGLTARLELNINCWNSSNLHQKERIKEYSQQFLQNLKFEIEAWQDKNLNLILKKNIEDFEQKIVQYLEPIKQNIISLASQSRKGFSKEIKEQIKLENIELDTKFFVGGIGIGVGAVGATLIAIVLPVSFPFWLFFSAACAVGAGIGLLSVGFDEQQELKIKKQVFDFGCKQFFESREEIFDEIAAIVDSIFNDRIELLAGVITQAISLYENILARQEKDYQEMLEQCNLENAWIIQKRQKLEQVQNEINVILNQCVE